MISEIVLKIEFSGPTLGTALLSSSGGEIARAEVAPKALDEVLRSSVGLAAVSDEVGAMAAGNLIASCFLPPPMQAAMQQEAKRELEGVSRLRIAIEFEDRSLGQIPWELLRFTSTSHDEPLDGFLALHPRVCICRRVRRVEGGNMTVSTPTRILVISSDPRTDRYPALGWVQAEVRAITAAFARTKTSDVQVRQVFDATPVVVERTLREFKPHVVHFAGHGEARPPDGALILQGATAGTFTILTASETGMMFSRSGVRLAVLAACDSGGAVSRTAEAIHRFGVPAVVAMQAAVRDSWQPQFARTFYGSLADGASVDEALSEVRTALSTSVERWAAPVLYTSGSVDPIIAQAPSSSYEHGRHNLSRQTGLFVGRDHDLTQVARILRSGVSRLVTICGTGGVGKSRLAEEVGRRVLAVFPDGVWRIECEAVRNPDDLLNAIATVLGIAGGGSDLAESLRGSHCLLLLDCLEGLAASGALEPIARLLAEAESVSVLATSRVRLGIDAEIVWHLRPLSHGKDGAAADSSSELFVGAAARQGMFFEDQDRALVREICSELEGLPLAILLAVGRLRYVGLADLKGLLENSRVQTLKEPGGRGGESGIGSAIARSLRIAPASDLLALRQICLFSGSFTLQDVTEVLCRDAFEALDSLQRLGDQSLLESASSASGNRFFVLDTIREYVSIADSGDGASSDLSVQRRRHAEHFAHRAEEVAQLMRAGQWEAAMRDLWNTLGNFRVAIRYCSNAGLDDLILRFGHGLGVTLMEAGYWSDFRDLASVAYPSSARLEDFALTTQLLGLEGAMAARLGNPARCEELWLLRAQECVRIGDSVGAADTFLDLAIQAYQAADGAESISLLAKAEPLLANVDRPDLLATHRTVRALVAIQDGDLGEALRCAEEAHRLAVGADKHDALLFVSTNLGRVWHACGEEQRARTALVGAIRGSLRADRKVQLGVALTELGAIHESLGQVETAFICFVGARGVYKEVGSRRGQEAEARLSSFKQRFGQEPAALRFEELSRVHWRELTNEALLRSAPEC